MKVTKIPNPTARYGFMSDIEKWSYANGNFYFRKSHTYVKEILGNKILSEYISYSFMGKNIELLPSVSCYQIDKNIPSYRTAKLLDNTLLISGE